MSYFKINAQVCIFSLTVVKVGKYVELTIVECELDGFLVIRVWKSNLELKTFHIGIESTFTFTFEIFPFKEEIYTEAHLGPIKK